eukprot:scaffold110430_cov18-Tisochrysis_lutea.AAC.2
MIMVHVGSHYLRMLRYGQQLMVLSLCTLLIVALRAHCCPIVAMQMAMPARSIVGFVSEENQIDVEWPVCLGDMQEYALISATVATATQPFLRARFHSERHDYLREWLGRALVPFVCPLSLAMSSAKDTSS